MLDCVDERIRPDALRARSRKPPADLVVATAGTTNAGAIDPLPVIADLARAHNARLHVDAAYGGSLLFSPTHAPLLAGIDRADTVALDLHKLGWQPIPAGLLLTATSADLAPLSISADYLNADDDLEAGLPDLLGRSLRTSRRADAFRIAVSLRAHGPRRPGRADRPLPGQRRRGRLGGARSSRTAPVARPDTDHGPVPPRPRGPARSGGRRRPGRQPASSAPGHRPGRAGPRPHRQSRWHRLALAQTDPAQPGRLGRRLPPAARPGRRHRAHHRRGGGRS